MTSKERMLRAMRNGKADCVPVAPDMSNMIPARLTGKPFWDIYLYQDPPLWLAYIEAVKHFGFDGFLDYQVVVRWPEEIAPQDPPWQRAIVRRTDERLYVQNFRETRAGIEWHGRVTVYYRDTPPTESIPLEKVGLPAVPEEWEPVTGVREWPKGEDLFALAYGLMGERGVLGVTCGSTGMSEALMYHFHDHPEEIETYAAKRVEAAEKRFERIRRMKVRPDYVSCGGSGTLIFQTPAMFRRVGLPCLKRVTALCKQEGLVSHMHSCGPEKLLVQAAAEETDLSVIDPLEVPPMGDCDLAEIKRRFGAKIALKGNLHTTEVMLARSPEVVREASRRAIDAAAEGGGFILSTGDQCGRDTPDENIHAMIETAREYGRYS